MKVTLSGLLNIGISAVVQGMHFALESPEQRQKEQQQQAKSEAAGDKLHWSYKSIVIAKSAVERILKDPGSAQYRGVYVVIPKNFNEAVSGVVCSGTGFADSKVEATRRVPSWNGLTGRRL